MLLCSYFVCLLVCWLTSFQRLIISIARISFHFFFLLFNSLNLLANAIHSLIFTLISYRFCLSLIIVLHCSCIVSRIGCAIDIQIVAELLYLLLRLLLLLIFALCFMFCWAGLSGQVELSCRLFLIHYVGFLQLSVSFIAEYELSSSKFSGCEMRIYIYKWIGTF